MKYLPLFLLALSLLIMGQQCQTEEAGEASLQADPAVAERLGPAVVEALQEADSLQVFQLDPLAELDSAAPTFRGTRVIASHDSVAEDWQRQLQKSLLTEANYLFDEDVKLCLFLPQWGLRWAGKWVIFDVAVSPLEGRIVGLAEG